MPGLIAIPHMGSVPVPFMQSFCTLMTQFHKVPGGPPATMWVGYHWTHLAREKAAEKCVKDKHDWLLFLDSDMTFPPDTIERLLSHNKPIVSGLCFKRQWPPRPTIYRSLDADMNSVANLTEWDPLQKIDAAGCACLLIRREVLEAVPAPWFALDEWPAAEDVGFFVKVRKAGIEAYADTTVSCGHVGPYEFGEADFQRAVQFGVFSKAPVTVASNGKVTEL